MRVTRLQLTATVYVSNIKYTCFFSRVKNFKDNLPPPPKKAGGVLGRGLGAILNAAAAGAESFEKSLSEEIEENEGDDQ